MSKHATLLLALLLFTPLLVVTVKPVSAATPDSWVTKAPMNQARSGLGVAAVNGKIYAIGGDTRQGSWPYKGGIVATNEEYDPATNTWILKSPMPTPRMDFGIAIYTNKIYCIGGEIIFKDESKAPLTNVNEIYDPATDTWETKEPMPTPRSCVRANVVNGKIYVIGGYDPSVHFDPGASNHNEVYDPATDSWTTKISMLTAASDYASAVFGDKIYVIGGFIGGRSTYLRFDLNQIYDTQYDNWSYGAPLTQGYGGVVGGATVGFMAPRRIFVFGAMRNDSTTESYYSARVYDPEYDSWKSGVDIPTGRGGFGVAVLDDTLYVIGGVTSVTASGIPFSGEAPIITEYATNEQYIPFGYGTPDPSYVPPVDDPPSGLSEAFSVAAVEAASTTIVIVVGLGLLVYLKKRKR